jgi:hypothetical protein
MGATDDSLRIVDRDNFEIARSEVTDEGLAVIGIGTVYVDSMGRMETIASRAQRACFPEPKTPRTEASFGAA